MFNLFDATKLTQWEQGKKLTNNHMTAGQKVLFSNSTGATAVMYAYDDGGIVKVNIPNELLQSAGKLIVDLDGSPSCRRMFNVKSADKPDNYTLVETDACTPPSINPREVKGMYYTEPGKTAEKITSITWDGNTSGLVKTTLTTGSGPTHYKVADLPDGWDADVVSNLNDLADSIKINGILLSEQEEYMTPSESERYNCWGARCADIADHATVTVVTQADTLAWTAQLENFEKAYPDAFTTLGTGLKDGILAERGRELTWENQRRRDLIRFGQFEKIQYVKNTAETRRWFPIPYTVLQKAVVDPETGKKIWTQNPGY